MARAIIYISLLTFDSCHGMLPRYDLHTNRFIDHAIGFTNRTLQLDGTSDVGQSFLRRWSPSPPLTSWVRCTCGLLLEIGGGNVV